MIVIPFVPQHEKEIVENLSAYIDHIKANTIFFRAPNAIRWDGGKWDLTPFYPTTGNVKTKAIFTDKAGKSGKPFPQPFMDEAKALLADFLRQSNTKQVSLLVAVLREIYDTLPLSDKGKTISSLSDTELYAVEEQIVEKFTDSYKFCRLLQRLVENIIEPARVTKSRLSWLSSQKYKGANRSDLVGERNRVTNTTRNKMPDLRCIMDLATVFNHSKYAPDVVVTSWFAISMYGPSRINEILTLPVNCERYDEESEGSGHGIAWVPEKGGDPVVKRAASEESAEVAHAAIQRLIDLGNSARRAAKWYEDNPDKLYLPAEWEHMRGMPLTLYEMSQILGREKDIPHGHVTAFGLKSVKRFTSDPIRTGGSKKKKLYTFASLEAYVLAKLPFGWPYLDQKTKLRYSEGLFTVPFGIMGGNTATCANIPQFVTSSMITHELGRKPSGRTIFARHNLINPETGEYWKLASHQPRHLLNTIAQSKHLSQELIAFWSGRKSVRQNDYYDHVGQEFFIEAYIKLEEHAPKELIVTGPLAEKVDARQFNEPISYEEAMKEELAAFHKTKYGYCRHDFSLTPCPKDKWCNNCGEAYFIKGDTRQIDIAEQEISRFNRSLTAARQAKEDGEFGVDQWIEKLEIDLERAILKLEKLTDPSNEDGTLITLPPPKVSQSKAGLSMEIRKTEHDQSDETDELITSVFS